MSVFDRAPVREPRPPRTEAQAKRAYRLKLAGMILAGVGSLAGVGTAYFKDRNDEVEQRGVDRYRLDVLERENARIGRELDAVRSSLLRLLHSPRNLPAPPADGDVP